MFFSVPLIINLFFSVPLINKLVQTCSFQSLKSINLFFSVPLINKLLRPIKKEKEKDKTEPVLNSRMEKLHFAFRMYDLDGDDKISKVLFFFQGFIFFQPHFQILEKFPRPFSYSAAGLKELFYF